MFLSVNNIRKMVKLADESKIDELEISSFGRKIRITKHQQSIASATSLPTQAVPETKKKEIVVEVPKQVEEIPENYYPIKSPMVGTFYRAPSPGAKPYVEVGQVIAAGQVLCIIEAMKLMNEIESEIPGRVVKVLVENAKPVEFGQILFLVEPF